MKLILPLALLLAGCEINTAPTPMPDQCLRAQLFDQCMKNIPKGPERTAGSNDWDEVVDSCQQASYYQPLRAAESIKKECRFV